MLKSSRDRFVGLISLFLVLLVAATWTHNHTAEVPGQPQVSIHRAAGDETDIDEIAAIGASPDAFEVPPDRRRTIFEEMIDSSKLMVAEKFMFSNVAGTKLACSRTSSAGDCFIASYTIDEWHLQVIDTPRAVQISIKKPKAFDRKEEKVLQEWQSLANKFLRNVELPLKLRCEVHPQKIALFPQYQAASSDPKEWCRGAWYQISDDAFEVTSFKLCRNFGIRTRYDDYDAHIRQMDESEITKELSRVNEHELRRLIATYNADKISPSIVVQGLLDIAKNRNDVFDPREFPGYIVSILNRSDGRNTEEIVKSIFDANIIPKYVRLEIFRKSISYVKGSRSVIIKILGDAADEDFRKLVQDENVKKLIQAGAGR